MAFTGEPGKIYYLKAIAVVAHPQVEVFLIDFIYHPDFVCVRVAEVIFDPRLKNAEQGQARVV